MGFAGDLFLVKGISSAYIQTTCRENIDNFLSKHSKTHDKPVRCLADPNCKTKTAENRDMDRHYRTAHKSYAKRNNIPSEEDVCDECGKMFTRGDNMKKHMRKMHRP